MKKIIFTLLAALFFAALLATPAFAETESLPLKLSSYEKLLTDGSEKQRVTVKEAITVTCETPVDSLYLIFYDKTADLTLRAGETEKTVAAPFLRQFISVSDLFGAPQSELVLSFSKNVGMLELYGFSEKVPSWVQIWQEPCEKADLCLMTTHADDEQLFFAGVLPYYAGEKGFEVQVIYFTDHVNTPLRRHELLRGLWTVGVEHYPVISSFPDLYSKDGAKAKSQLRAKGFSYEELVGFQVEMLRRFKPLVVVGHDPKGEYGHGQHIVNSATLQEAVRISADKEAYPESAERYGVWDVPKTYLHLLKDNPITMNWDVPLEHFGGKTAFQVTQDGFACHQSQHKYWFYRWLYGNGSITRASQITTFSPCNYGLFRSLVGEDVEKNDFFENQLSYDQIREKEEAERLRLEEEKRKEEERKQAEEKAALEAEQKKTSTVQNTKASGTLQKGERPAETKKLFWIIAFAGAAVCVAAAFISFRSNGRHRRF